ncbi:MAG TPA: hypothetical protein VNS31_13825 [Ramlibacter sp.]|nr:hypothetical protein [Ramlibacter sp.]
MRSLFASLLAAIILCACGGGGDDSAPSSITAGANPQEGLFLGFDDLASFGGFQRNTQLVLEDGETWIVNDSTPDGRPTFFVRGPFTFVSRTSASTTTVTSTVTGTTTTVGTPSVVTTFSNPSALLSAGSSTLVTGSITFVSSGVAPNETSANRVVSSIFTDGFARQLASATLYDYNKPAGVADIAGSWVFDNPGRPVPQATLAVASSGAVSGSNATTGCAYAGTLTPRPSGKNVFNVAITVTGCADAGAYSGVSYSFLRLGPNFGDNPPPVPVLKLFAITPDKTRVLNLQMARS